MVKKLQLAMASTSLSPDQLVDFQKVMPFRNGYRAGTVLYRNCSSSSEKKIGIIGILDAIEEFTTYQTESISLAVPIERNLLKLATDDYCKDKAIQFA